MSAAEDQTTHQAIDSLNDAFNRHDAGALAELLTDDTVFEGTSPAPGGKRIEEKSRCRGFLPFLV